MLGWFAAALPVAAGVEPSGGAAHEHGHLARSGGGGRRGGPGRDHAAQDAPVDRLARRDAVPRLAGGPARCIHVLEAYVLGTPGEWRMMPTSANGQPAAAVYHRDAGGALRADGVVVLAPTATGIARVVKSHDPALVGAVGLPGVLPS